MRHERWLKLKERVRSEATYEVRKSSSGGPVRSCLPVEEVEEETFRSSEVVGFGLVVLGLSLTGGEELDR